MKNFFESPFKGKIIQDHITNPNIISGKYSYYSGYYHGHSFDDCARYLFPDRDDVDQLIRVCLLNPNQAHNFICGPSG